MHLHWQKTEQNDATDTWLWSPKFSGTFCTFITPSLKFLFRRYIYESDSKPILEGLLYETAADLTQRITLVRQEQELGHRSP